MEPVFNLFNYIALPVITSFIFLLVFFVVIFSVPTMAKRRIKKLKKTLGSKIKDRKTEIVTFYSQDDLADGGLRPRDARIALLVFGNDRSVEFFQASSSDAYIHDTFDQGEAQIELIDNSEYGGMLASLVRVHSQDHSRYFFRRKRSGSPDAKATTELYKLLAATVDPLNGKKIEKKSTHPLIYLALLLLVSLLATTLWSSWQNGSSSFPMILAESPDSNIAAASQKYIYILDKEGALKQKIALSELGLSGGVSDIEYLDNDKWLVADEKEGLIKECNIKKKTCMALPKSQKGMLSRPFKFAIDKKNSRIYVASASQHRLVALSIEGELLTEIANRESGLCFPNDPLLVNDELFVTNTNHHEIRVWNVSSEKYLLSDKQLTVKQGRHDVDCPAPEDSKYLAFFARERMKGNGDRAVVYEYSREGRIWPYAIARIEDQLWVINGGDALSFGDIVRFYDDTDMESERISFNEKLDPVMMLGRGSDVLIAEAEKGFIHRVATDGKSLGFFGDKSFKNEIIQIKNNMEKMGRLSTYGLYGLLVFFGMLITLLLVFRARRIKYIVNMDPAFEREK